jgi:hypothetical protein
MSLSHLKFGIAGLAATSFYRMLPVINSSH